MRKSVPFFSDSDNDPSSLTIDSVQQIIPKIEDDLTGSLLWYSQNARYVPESLKIISIEYSQESRYKMTYSFRWNVFNGCLDIDAYQTTTESVNFEWQSDKLIFDFIETEQISAADEL